MGNRLLIAIVGLLLPLVAHAAGRPLPEPPFVRKWTYVASDNGTVIGVRDRVVYVSSVNGISAMDLATGKMRWTCLPNVRRINTTLDGQAIYAVAQAEKRSTLHRIDIRSGGPRTLARLPGTAASVAAGFGRVFVLEESATLRAYDANTGRLQWSCQLGPVRQRGVLLGSVAATTGGLYAGLDEAGEFGIDPASGRVLWHHTSKYAGLNPPRVVGGDVVTWHDTLKRTNVRTGRIVWRGGEGSGAEIVGEVVITGAQKGLVGHSLADGHVLWRRPLQFGGPSYMGQVAPPPISDGESAWLLGESIICMARDGRVRWDRKAPFTGTPFYADSNMVVTCAVARIFGYMRGTLPPIPTAGPGKRLLAGRLAARFEILGNEERQRLAELSPYAFRPLLGRYVEWAKAWEVNPRGRQSQELYGLLTDSQPLLRATARKEDTPAIVAAWNSLGPRGEWRQPLEGILEAKGDPAAYVPLLVEHLRHLAPRERNESTALSAVAHSKEPKAIAFMLEALRDPKPARDWRRAAFAHLAGTGGAIGAAAVSAARPRPGARRPWWELLDLNEIEHSTADPGGKIAVKTDSRDRTWMLFASEVLGNGSDLFIVEKQGATWGRPLFTGAFTERTWHLPAPVSFRGVPIAKLVSTEWIRIFPDDAAIRQDSDGDGLTDLVEARMGTAPAKSDTDGDGLPDAVDPCPNAAPRPMGDAEKIVAACIEARFFEEAYEVPAVLSVPGVTPFEVYGYSGTVVWESGDKQGPLSRMYAGGVNVIGFGSPNDSDRRDAPFIVYSPDHRTARTIISRYSGGLNGDGTEVTLRKIGDEWFVVDMRLRYVS